MPRNSHWKLRAFPGYAPRDLEHERQPRRRDRAEVDDVVLSLLPGDRSADAPAIFHGRQVHQRHGGAGGGHLAPEGLGREHDEVEHPQRPPLECQVKRRPGQRPRAAQACHEILGVQLMHVVDNPSPPQHAREQRERNELRIMDVVQRGTLSRCGHRCPSLQARQTLQLAAHGRQRIDDDAVDRLAPVVLVLRVPRDSPLAAGSRTPCKGSSRRRRGAPWLRDRREARPAPTPGRRCARPWGASSHIEGEL